MKKLLLCLLLCLSPLAHAFDVNAASAFELETMRGIGQKMAQNIIVERNAHGVFKDWAAFTGRFKGVGDKSLKKMQDNGLTLKDKK